MCSRETDLELLESGTITLRKVHGVNLLRSPYDKYG